MAENSKTIDKVLVATNLGWLLLEWILLDA